MSEEIGSTATQQQHTYLLIRYWRRWWWWWWCWCCCILSIRLIHPTIHWIVYNIDIIHVCVCVFVSVCECVCLCGWMRCFCGRQTSHREKDNRPRRHYDNLRPKWSYSQSSDLSNAHLLLFTNHHTTHHTPLTHTHIHTHIHLIHKANQHSKSSI